MKTGKKKFEGNINLNGNYLSGDGDNEGVFIHPDGIVDLPKQSRIRVAKSASTQVISTATSTKIVLEVEAYDSQNEFDNITTYRFTATKTGYYSIVGHTLYLAPVADEYYGLELYKNGALISSSTAQASYTDNIGVTLTDTIYLGTNDYIELNAFHTAGVDKSLYNDIRYTFLTIHKLS